MAYVITALSSGGDIQECPQTAEAALDAAMRLEAQGCRLVRVTGPEGREYNVTQFYRTVHDTGIFDLD